MFQFNRWDVSEPLRMTLVRPDGEMICELNGVDVETVQLTLNVNNQYELFFDYNKYIEDDGELIRSNGYDYLNVEMRVLLENIGLFRLVYPPYDYDGNMEKKHVEAYSIDSELEDKELFEFKINTGEDDSLENLVEYDDDETEPLLNGYTGLPYDYIVFKNTYAQQLEPYLNKYSDGIHEEKEVVEDIVELCHKIPRVQSVVLEDEEGEPYAVDYVSYIYNENEEIQKVALVNFNQRIEKLIDFYNKYGDQLSVIDLAIDQCSTTWSVGEIDPELANKKMSFSVSENIYAFLTQDVAEAAQCVFSFDLFNMEINATSIDNLGVESNVILTRDKLENALNVTCDDNRLVTRYNVDSESVNIIYYNFGRTDIDDLSYFLNARDQNGDLIYMTEELARKYKQFVKDRDDSRDRYAELTKEYNKYNMEIDELMYKVPDDIVQIDYTSYTEEELETTKRGYYNLFVSLIAMYRADYGEAGFEDDKQTVKESFIKNTPYYADYFCYQQAMEQVDRVLYDRHSTSVKEQTTEEKAETIERYKTEWQLYGISELGAKVDGYLNKLQVMIDGGAIICKHYYEMWSSLSEEEKRQYVDEAAYNATLPYKWGSLEQSVKDSYANWEENYRFEPKAWNELNAEEKRMYGSLSENYYYPIYYKAYAEMKECHAYMVQLQEQVKILEGAQEGVANARRNITKYVTLENYDSDILSQYAPIEVHEPITFTDREIATIKRLYIDGTYENENILTTNLDDTVSEVDISKELYEDAKEDLSIMSQPQLSISTSIDNLLAMKEFEGFTFVPGNYVYVEYFDGYYLKLRLASIVLNPCVPTNQIEVTFTNFINSASKRSDLTYLLGLSSSRGNVTRSSGGGGTSGTGYGSDLDVNISNKMLTRLLSSQKFDSKVADVVTSTIRVNTIMARYANFDGLAVGSTKVDGKCISTGWIVSTNYNGDSGSGSIDNTAGTILNLDNGEFNFAGGKLKYTGGTLTVNGSITANSGSIGGFQIESTSIHTANVAIGSNATNSVALSSQNFKRTVAGAERTDLRFAIGSYFGVSGSGALYASSGEIGGFAFDATSIHTKGVTVGSNAQSSVALTNQDFARTIGTTPRSGLRLAIGSNFGVTSNGTVYANNMTATGGTFNNISATGGTFTNITATNASVSGSITATSGEMGGFTVESNSIHTKGIAVTSKAANSIALSTVDFSREIDMFGFNDLRFAIGSNFAIRSDGSMYAGNVTANVMDVQELKVSNQITMGYVNDHMGLGYDCKVLRLTADNELNSYLFLGEDADYYWLRNAEGDIRLYLDTTSPDAVQDSDNNTVSDAALAWLAIRNGIHNISVQTNHVGNAGLHDTTFGKWMIYTNYKGTVINGASSSDERIKHDIRDTQINNALEQILKIRHREFTFNENNVHVSNGYIAQELEKINEEMVHKPESEDEIYHVNDFYMLSLITKAIQELYAEFDERIKRLQK